MTEAPDSIYFLMFPEWEKEFRSNRWHYASRWARHLPVVLVQTRDELQGEYGISADEPRIPGTRILYVGANATDSPTFLNGLCQVRQVLNDMERHGYQRPILWAYDPQYLLSYASVPAAMRVYHATENYFAFEGLTAKFMASLSSMVQIADLVVAVSDGVAQSFQTVASQPVEVVTNGCEYELYAGGKPDQELAALGADFEQIAVYGGNINDRLDFDLITKLVQSYPRTLFAFFGRVARLDSQDEATWSGLAKYPNFRHFGAVPAERLPDVYMTAHVGIAPYKQRADLLGNLFPLKIFEMLSAGIPVVSSPFDSLLDKTGPALRLAGDDDGFVAALAATDRRGLSESDLQQLATFCRAQDYDEKFTRVRDLILSRARAKATAPLASLLAVNGAGELQRWLTNVTEATAAVAATPADLFRRLWQKLSTNFLNWVDLNFPAWVRYLVYGSLKVVRMACRAFRSRQNNHQNGQR
ncbi:MAG: glycosyltransferase [Bacteroidales bacterium]